MSDPIPGAGGDQDKRGRKLFSKPRSDGGASAPPDPETGEAVHENPASDEAAGANKGNGGIEEVPPELEELPEEPAEEENRPSVAAAAEKFKQYGKMKRDPKAGIVPIKKRLIAIPPRKSPHGDWFVRTSRNPQHNGILPLFWDKGGDDGPYLVGAPVQYLLPKTGNNYCVIAVT